MPLLWFKVYSTFQPCRENSKQSYHPLDQIYLTSPLHCRQESISSGITFFHETLANFQKISEWNPSSPPSPPLECQFVSVLSFQTRNYQGKLNNYEEYHLKTHQTFPCFYNRILLWKTWPHRATNMMKLCTSCDQLWHPSFHRSSCFRTVLGDL